jgi:hypothetical protein
MKVINFIAQIRQAGFLSQTTKRWNAVLFQISALLQMLYTAKEVYVVRVYLH